MNKQNERTDQELTQRLTSVLQRYKDSQRDGVSREVLHELERMSREVDKNSPVDYVKIQIAIASIEDELGLNHEARERLMACREIARYAQALDQCRLAYYWGIACVREDLFEEAAQAIEYFEEGLSRVEVKEPRLLLHYDFLRGVFAERTLDFEAASGLLRRCAQVTEPASHMWSSARSGLARIAIMEFRFDDAILTLDGLLQLEDEIGGHATSQNVGLKACALVGSLRIDEAIEYADRAIEMTSKRGLYRASAEAALIRTVAISHRGDEESAEQSLAESVSLNVATVYREFASLLKAWLRDQPLPSVNEKRGQALRKFLESGAKREAVTEPSHAAISAVVKARRSAVDYDTLSGKLHVGGDEHDISRRGALRRILERLIEDRESGGNGVETPDLFEAGWPDVANIGPNGFRRVYTEIYRLRDMGLKITSVEGGYLLETEVEKS